MLICARSRSVRQRAPSTNPRNVPNMRLTFLRQTFDYIRLLARGRGRPSSTDFVPRRSRRRVGRGGIAGDGDTWVELSVHSRRKTGRLNRALFYSIRTRNAYWDEPQTGASEVVLLSDFERLESLAEEARQKDDDTAMSSSPATSECRGHDEELIDAIDPQWSSASPVWGWEIPSLDLKVNTIIAAAKTMLSSTRNFFIALLVSLSGE